MRSGNLHIGLAISHFLTDLVIDTTGNELCERACKRNLSGNRQSGSHAYHIGLGNAALDESFRKIIGKCIHLQRALQVGSKSYDSGISLAGFIETGTESASGIFLSRISIFRHIDISLSINNRPMFPPTE